MAKYRIACLAGDGVGIDVLDATQIVASKVSFDAEYIRRNIAWELWRKEGAALPPRTLHPLKNIGAEAQHYLRISIATATDVDGFQQFIQEGKHLC